MDVLLAVWMLNPDAGNKLTWDGRTGAKAACRVLEEQLKEMSGQEAVLQAVSGLPSVAAGAQPLNGLSLPQPPGSRVSGGAAQAAAAVPPAASWVTPRQMEALKGASFARKLHEKLRPQLQAEGLLPLLNNIEMPLVGVRWVIKPDHASCIYHHLRSQLLRAITPTCSDLGCRKSCFVHRGLSHIPQFSMSSYVLLYRMTAIITYPLCCTPPPCHRSRSWWTWRPRACAWTPRCC